MPLRNGGPDRRDRGRQSRRPGDPERQRAEQDGDAGSEAEQGEQSPPIPGALSCSRQPPGHTGRPSRQQRHQIHLPLAGGGRQQEHPEADRGEQQPAGLAAAEDARPQHGRQGERPRQQQERTEPQIVVERLRVAEASALRGMDEAACRVGHQTLLETDPPRRPIERQGPRRHQQSEDRHAERGEQRQLAHRPSPPGRQQVEHRRPRAQADRHHALAEEAEGDGDGDEEPRPPRLGRRARLGQPREAEMGHGHEEGQGRIHHHPSQVLHEDQGRAEHHDRQQALARPAQPPPDRISGEQRQRREQG